jgi:hypothetical protein
MKTSFSKTSWSLNANVIPSNRFGWALVNDERKRLISFNVKWEKPLSLSACATYKNLTFGRLISHRRPETPKKGKRLSLNWWRKLVCYSEGKANLPAFLWSYDTCSGLCAHSLGLRKMLFKMSSWCEPLINQDLNYIVWRKGRKCLAIRQKDGINFSFS